MSSESVGRWDIGFWDICRWDVDEAASYPTPTGETGKTRFLRKHKRLLQAFVSYLQLKGET